ncbi:MAG: VOC family protein [Terracidiphilus sp.]|jgi:catechol 2,3-dioxygenase-like lactoylglutathione lyase family enzyme
MVEAIERMLTDLERGKLTRRQFAVSVAGVATAALSAPATLAASAGSTGFRAISLNHITVRVPDLQRTSRFYQEFFGMPLRQQAPKVHILGVGSSFFGIEQGDGQAAIVDHFDFGIENFNADKVRARLSELNLKFTNATSQESFKFLDPDGFQVQVNGPDYVGHVS